MDGYKFKTTFWQDFTIADHFGIEAVKDIYKRAFKEWKNNTEYLTELVLVLNWKIWQHYEQDHHALASLYNTLWEQADNYALDHLKGNDLTYYLNTID